MIGDERKMSAQHRDGRVPNLTGQHGFVAGLVETTFHTSDTGEKCSDAHVDSTLYLIVRVLDLEIEQK